MFQQRCGFIMDFTIMQGIIMLWHVLSMQEEKNCTTALSLACSEGHKAVVDLLIQKGANVNYQDKVCYIFVLYYFQTN